MVLFYGTVFFEMVRGYGIGGGRCRHRRPRHLRRWPVAGFDRRGRDLEGAVEPFLLSVGWMAVFPGLDRWPFHPCREILMQGAVEPTLQTV